MKYETELMFSDLEQLLSDTLAAKTENLRTTSCLFEELDTLGTIGYLFFGRRHPLAIVVLGQARQTEARSLATPEQYAETAHCFNLITLVHMIPVAAGCRLFKGRRT